MKYGLPLFTTELSGKLGGIVGSKARGGVGYFRRRVNPSNPQSPAQLVARAITSGIAAAWLTLSQTQRDNWSAIADAESSGIDAYVKGNFQLLMGGDARVDDAPASLALPSPQLFDGCTLEENTGPGEDEPGLVLPSAFAGYGCNLYVSSPQSPTRASRQYPFRYAGTFGNGDESVNFPSGHPAASIVSGQVVYCRLVEYNDDGQVATAQTFRLRAFGP